MISAVRNAVDNFFGRGDAAVTVPPLDGALKPNSLLDDAKTRHSLNDVDCLAVLDGKLVASAGETILKLDHKNGWTPLFETAAPISSIAEIGNDGLAIALDNGDVEIHGGAFAGKRYSLGDDFACITAMVERDGALYLTNGSSINGAANWQRDLMQRNASGSVWRVELSSGRPELLADKLAWPAGLALDDESLVVSEAWRHRLVRVDLSTSKRVDTPCHDLPAYPGRLSRASGGWWLAGFAPRSQLVEFILREPGYRKRMLEQVPQDYWIAPKLRSGRSFYEPLQGGGVKHLGQLKPWAPAMSAGLCVRLDEDFRPVASLQSRADGMTHGTSSVVELNENVFVASQGDGVVVQMPESESGGTQ